MKLSLINFSFFIICTMVLVHTCTSSPATAIIPDELSVMTRYGGMGYNALEANPEGEFSQAALNPGIKRTRFIFNHTYCNQKLVYYRGQAVHVPDQVEFHPSASCYSEEAVNAYSGQTSYQNELSYSVEISGSASYLSLFKAQFSLSNAMKNVRNATEQQHSCIVQKTRTCSYGEVRYKLASALIGANGYTLTEEFKNAVRLLPLNYSQEAYTQFIDDWGTHIIESVRVGTRHIQRNETSYLEVYDFLAQQVSAGASASLGYNGFIVDVDGSVTLDIMTLDRSVTQSTQLGRSLKEIIIGRPDHPMPIWTKVVSIITAFTDVLWSSSERESIQEKRDHLDRALSDYAMNKNAQITPDPSMKILIPWPKGLYSLLKVASGCPTGMSSGWRLQDNEDSNNANRWTPQDIDSCIDIGLGGDIKMYYCTKTSEAVGTSWPKGTYCIAKHGSSCPSGFFSGSIYWDDEDSNNKNSLMHPVPSGRYDRNTKIEFCCRSDGHHDNPMLLPPTEPFALYQYEGKCQQVYGMNDPKELFVHYDDENSNNHNACSGNHPGGDSCSQDHELYFCYYTPLGYNRCDYSPCENGGTCVASNSTCSGYSCMCAPHYVGTNCESLSGNLGIYARSGTNLPDSDGWLNNSDPYMQVTAVDEDGNSVTKRTRYIQGNHNPVWNQWLQFGTRTWKKFTVRVYDDDYNADDLLCGEMTVDLTALGSRIGMRYNCRNGYVIFDYQFN